MAPSSRVGHQRRPGRREVDAVEDRHDRQQHAAQHEHRPPGRPSSLAEVDGAPVDRVASELLERPVLGLELVEPGHGRAATRRRSPATAGPGGVRQAARIRAQREAEEQQHERGEEERGSRRLPAAQLGQRVLAGDRNRHREARSRSAGHRPRRRRPRHGRGPSRERSTRHGPPPPPQPAVQRAQPSARRVTRSAWWEATSDGHARLPPVADQPIHQRHPIRVQRGVGLVQQDSDGRAEERCGRAPGAAASRPRRTRPRIRPRSQPDRRALGATGRGLARPAGRASWQRSTRFSTAVRSS